MGVAVGVWFLGLLALVAGSPLQRDFPEYSAELIRKINAMNTTWKAGPNFVGETAKSVLGRLRSKGQPLDEVPVDVHGQKNTRSGGIGAALPDQFDSRNQWSKCNASIGHIFAEGRCKAGWAIPAIGAIRDRYCIKNNGAQFNFSAEDALTCIGGVRPSNGCNGKGIQSVTSSWVWRYWAAVGFVSGGDWNSTSGCKPYGYFPCDHYESGTYGPCQSPPAETPCHQFCRPGYPHKYEDDIRKGKSWKKIDAAEEAIQKEIYTSGPVSAQISLYKDFLMYRSGVYHETSSQYLGWHGVKIIGWGVENKTKYWLCTNSWNDQWGDKGFVKIRRGLNEIGIEAEVYTGYP